MSWMISSFDSPRIEYPERITIDPKVLYRLNGWRTLLIIKKGALSFRQSIYKNKIGKFDLLRDNLNVDE